MASKSASTIALGEQSCISSLTLAPFFERSKNYVGRRSVKKLDKVGESGRIKAYENFIYDGSRCRGMCYFDVVRVFEF